MAQSTDFKIMPEPSELARMERDLRFHPCINERPRCLTRDQVDQFNRLGYLKGLRIFDREEADAHRRYFDALLARVLAAGGDSYSVSTAHLKHGVVYDLLTHPRIVAPVRDLLGE